MLFQNIASDASQTLVRRQLFEKDFEMLRLTPDIDTLYLTCDFKILRLTPARRPPDASQAPRFEIGGQTQDFSMMCSASPAM